MQRRKLNVFSVSFFKKLNAIPSEMPPRVKVFNTGYKVGRVWFKLTRGSRFYCPFRHTFLKGGTLEEGALTRSHLGSHSDSAVRLTEVRPWKTPNVAM